MSELERRTHDLAGNKYGENVPGKPQPEPSYCSQAGCLRRVYRPYLYCDKHQDRASTPAVEPLMMRCLECRTYGGHAADCPIAQPEPTAESADKQVGRLIRRLRGSMNQTDFAKRYGLQHNSVSYWEHGTPTIPAQLTLDLFATAKAEGRRELAEQLKAKLYRMPGTTAEVVRAIEIDAALKGDTDGK